jgi:ATP-dependent DNA helicase RecG
MTSVQQLQGVGAAAATLLEKLHIFSTDDLLFHLPRDYEDRSTIIPMNQLVVGRSYLLEGEVRSVDFPPGKKKSLAALLQDDFGKVTLRFYHIYKGLTDRIKMGQQLEYSVKFVLEHVVLKCIILKYKSSNSIRRYPKPNSRRFILALKV